MSSREEALGLLRGGSGQEPLLYSTMHSRGVGMCVCACARLLPSLSTSVCFHLCLPLPQHLWVSLCVFSSLAVFLCFSRAAFRLCVSCSVYCNCCSHACFLPPEHELCAKSALHLHIVGASYIPVGFPDGSAGKESTCDAGDTGDAGLIPGSGRSPGGGNGKPTPVFLSGKPHGQRSRVGYNLWDCRELDTIEHSSTHIFQWNKSVDT